MSASVSARDAARRTIALAGEGLKNLSAELAESFDQAVEILAAVKGRVIVSGMGKSGHVGRKIAATFSSTGTPAQFVHPAEAGHGDLGMVTRGDAILALSWSGETTELRALVSHAARFSIPLVAITSSRDAALGRAAQVVLKLPAAEEACPNGLAPTTSTTMQMVLGDALAMALLERNGLTATAFHDLHPGGMLGARLATAQDIMHQGDSLPLAPPEMPMSEALVIMSEKGFGCIGVVEGGVLRGMITDGDLRRHMSPGLLDRRTGEVMTGNPRTISATALAGEILALFNREKIACIFVVDSGRPVGLIHMHDVLRRGVM